VGCCASKEEDRVIETTSPVKNPALAAASSAPSPPHRTSAPHTLGTTTVSASVKEQKIETIFRSKRGNVFTAGMDEVARNTFVAKKIPKSAKQEQLIKEALKENFVFSSLDDSDIRVLVDSMEVVDITAGENVITEGQEGDYYYVVESGSFTVTVGGKVVGSIGVGKGFGELALLHNTPRAATVRADKVSTVLSLDRSTFRFIIAQRLVVFSAFCFLLQFTHLYIC